jgi:acetyltransferase-like isoleucine patch superfamily enzyme
VGKFSNKSRVVDYRIQDGSIFPSYTFTTVMTFIIEEGWSYYLMRQWWYSSGGFFYPTFIGDDVWMLKHSHVGHDCYIHSKVTISCGVKVGGHTIVRYKCNLGLNAVIHQKQDIAIGCMIGMGSVVTKKLITQAFKKYAGNPAKEIGDNAIYRNP